MFTKIFAELNLSKISESVFNDLLTKGPSTARQLAERLDLPRPSVYDHIKILEKNGLVTEKVIDGKKVFSVDNISHIPELLEDKIESLRDEKKKFVQSLPSLLKNINFIEPRIKFYSGAEGLKQVMNHVMWHDNIDTIIMWPMSEMIKVLGEDYLRELNKKRIKNKISIRGIWPKDKKIDFKRYPFLGVGAGHLRDIRFAPKGMTWNMGYWLYEDKVAFLSSQKESFGFVVQSQDFSDLMRAQFDEIWKNSETVKPRPELTDSFLESIS